MDIEPAISLKCQQARHQGSGRYMSCQGMTTRPSTSETFKATGSYFEPCVCECHPKRAA